MEEGVCIWAFNPFLSTHDLLLVPGAVDQALTWFPLLEKDYLRQRAVCMCEGLRSL